MDVTVIGYGSLMSGQGLSLSGMFQVRQAFVVALANCTRGFAKLSRYGDRFAMNLEITRLPLEGRVVSLASTPNGEVEALALTVPLADLCRLAKREGYLPAALQRLQSWEGPKGSTLRIFCGDFSTEPGKVLLH